MRLLPADFFIARLAVVSVSLANSPLGERDEFCCGSQVSLQARPGGGYG